MACVAAMLSSATSTPRQLRSCIRSAQSTCHQTEWDRCACNRGGGWCRGQQGEALFVVLVGFAGRHVYSVHGPAVSKMASDGCCAAAPADPPARVVVCGSAPQGCAGSCFRANMLVQQCVVLRYAVLRCAVQVAMSCLVNPPKPGESSYEQHKQV